VSRPRSHCRLILALVALAGASSAQSLAPTWQAQFDGPAHMNDSATSAAVLPSGEVAVVGSITVEQQPGVFVPQFFTTLYSPQGLELWSRIHPSGANSTAEKVAISPTGAIIAAGTRDQGADWIVVQYNVAGTQEWEGVWPAGSSFLSHVEDLAVDDFGEVYLCGNVSAGAGVAKFSTTGTLLWFQTYQGTGLEIGSVHAITISAAGEVFLTGSTSGTAGELLFSVARIEPVNGQPYWIQQFGPTVGFSYSEGQALATDALGNVVACGRTSDYFTMTVAITLVALAPDGSLVWRQDRDKPNTEWAVVEDLAVDAAGNIAAAGWTASTAAWNLDGFLLRLNDGVFAWEHPFAGAGSLDDQAFAVDLDALGNVYVAGWAQDPTPGFDAFEYAPNGALIAHGRAPAPPSGNAIAHGLAVGAGGRAYVVGNMTNFPQTGGDAVTAAFDLGPPVESVCFGDGTGSLCPCGNASPAGANAGCTNSIGVSGTLSADGAAHIGTDTLVIHATGLPDGPGLYFQGSSLLGGGAGIAFGDGLLCVSGAIVRLGVVFAANHASDYPGGATPLPISIAGSCTPGDARSYQVWYRDAAGTFCTSAFFNLTSALSVTWIP
jgi:hypothetical protein